MDRRRVWGEGAATEPALGCFTYRGRTADGKKMVNKYAAIVCIRLNASMIKQKKDVSCCRHSLDRPNASMIKQKRM